MAIPALIINLDDHGERLRACQRVCSEVLDGPLARQSGGPVPVHSSTRSACRRLTGDEDASPNPPDQRGRDEKLDLLTPRTRHRAPPESMPGTHTC